MRRGLLLLLAAGALAGCGKMQKLAPAAGKALPVKPATSPNQPDAVQLLASPTQFRPGRSDDLLYKSQVRPDDHFDLPPR
ncbi:hypothetical protein [Sphingomonas sp.]|uniref:hypothetical protein n=1 Tax=Sphingomonas sp. TaxID=28214 RepID=UPI000DB74883|nr:hypothetical protein [Sphingomonas sp.]PZU11930.1 MAG: hypothetical protein DI605_03015 [Sphingomonas sp.]